VLWLIRVPFLIAWLIIALKSFTLAAGIAWSYFYSETSIAFWIHRGCNPTVAALIAASLGDVADINLWMLAFYELEFWTSLLRRFLPKRWMSGSTEPEKANLTSWKYRLRYPAIFILSCVPHGGIWMSLGIARFLQLNRWGVLGLVLIGNTVKNMFFGIVLAFLVKYGASKTTVDRIIIAAVVLTAIVLAYKILRKMRPRFTLWNRTAILPLQCKAEE